MSRGRHEADFAHSLADLMSGVAVMFLVIAAIFMVQASRAKQTLAQTNKEQAAKLASLKQRDQKDIDAIIQLRAQLAAIDHVELVPTNDPRLVEVLFDRDSVHFPSGACDVDRATRETLRSTLRSIFPLICAAGGTLEKTITLEGHTDNEPPVSGVTCKAVAPAIACTAAPGSKLCAQQGFASNLRLSGARADFVFDEARDALDGNAAVVRCLEHDITVSGRGQQQPFEDAPARAKRTPEQNNNNDRRVVIKVRILAKGAS